MTIEEKLKRVENELAYANSHIDDIKEMLNVPEEVKNFLLVISVHEDVPKEVREKASTLWKKVY